MEKGKMKMFDFAEITNDMSEIEILNYYRNLYYTEPQVTERGIVANAINDMFDLINRQRAEIERLKECPKCVYEYDGEVMEYCVQSPCSNFKTIEQIKAEAYKEFAMKLQAFCKRIIAQKWNEKAAPISWSYAYADFIDDIDNLLKEMVGEGE